MPARASRSQSNFSPGSRFLPGRHVGMGEHAMRRNCVAAQDIAAQRLDGAHLGVGEIRIVEIVAGIMDLDADRA